MPSDQYNLKELSESYQITDGRIATEKVLSFLNKTQTFTGSQSRSESFPDVDIAEGKWLLEVSSNYVSNTNLGLKSQESVSYSLQVENVNTAEGVKMRGDDMVSKFDELYSQLGSYESNNGRNVKYLDVQISAVSDATTSIAATVKYGSLGEAISSNVTESLNIFDAAEYLEEKINEEYYQSISSQNGLVISGVWFASVTIFSTLPSDGFFINSPEEGYFFSTAVPLQANTSPYCYPTDLLDLYMPLQVNAMQTYIDEQAPGVQTELFNCNYYVSYLPDAIDEPIYDCPIILGGRHIINELTYGIGLAY